MRRHQFKFLILSIIIFLQVFSANSYAEKAIKTSCANRNCSEHFLTLSDIHFNPFYTCENTDTPCPIIEKLRFAPVTEWQNIFAEYDNKPQVYDEDTGFLLFQSGLKELKNQTNKQKIQFVLILGDILGHHFKENYQHYTGDLTQDGIQSFVNKTIQFIVHELTKTFKGADVYPVVGNNDTYEKHYVSVDEYYKLTAPIFMQLIKDKASKTKMVQMYSQAGYYALDLPQQKNIRLIVMNSTFFSIKYTGSDVYAYSQLAWLHEELQALAPHQQKAIIAFHIPAAIDVDETIESGKISELWQNQYANQFFAELQLFGQDIIAIFSGHLHSDWFQVIKLTKNKKAIPVFGIPSISPNSGNNPGFKIYSYHPQTFIFENYKTQFFDLSGSRQWKALYKFNKIYQKNCSQCNVLNGMQNLRQKGYEAEQYKKFYALKRNVQPITLANKWVPYYWCSIQNVLAKDYALCLLGR